MKRAPFAQRAQRIAEGMAEFSQRVIDARRHFLARQTQAFAIYQQTVIEALADMETALALYLRETDRQQALAEAAAQNRKSVDLAVQQFKSGYAGLLDLLVAQRDELEADASLATSETLLRKNLVHIYAAAGGGW